MAKNPYDPTQDPTRSLSPDEILRSVGPDATASFDNSASNVTEFASSEASGVEGNNEDLEDADDYTAIEEAAHEESEGEDVEDEAYINSRGPAR